MTRDDSVFLIGLNVKEVARAGGCDVGNAPGNAPGAFVSPTLGLLNIDSLAVPGRPRHSVYPWTRAARFSAVTAGPLVQIPVPDPLPELPR